MSEAGACDNDMSAMTGDVATKRFVMGGAVPWTNYEGDVRARRGSAVWGVRRAVEEGRMCKVLLLHGEEDGRVPGGQGVATRRACEA